MIKIISLALRTYLKVKHKELLIITLLVYFFSILNFVSFAEVQENKIINTYISECSKVFERKDMAAHKFIAPKYFEWWFTLGILDNGYTFVANFWITESRCWVNLTIYPTDNEAIHSFQEFDLKEIIADEKKCYIKMGRNYVYEKNGNYYLKIIGNEVKMDIGIARGVTGLKCKKEEGNPSLWLVAIPRGKLSGKLWVKKKWIPIKGIGYQEYVCHSGRFTRKDMGYEKFYYELIYTKNFTFIFLEPIYSPSKNSVFGVVKMGNNLDVPIRDLKFAYLDTVISNKTNREYPQRIKIDLGDRGIVNLQIKKILEESDKYFRILNDAEISLYIGKEEYKEKGISYSEVVYLR